MIEYNEKKGKNVINKTIAKIECNKWKENMENKATLKHYKNKQKPSWESFYNGSWESKIYYKARCGSLETNDRTKNWNNDIFWCQKCSQGNEIKREDIEHIILECETYQAERDTLENEMIEEIGREEWQEYKNNENNGILVILGFEWVSQKCVEISKNFLKKSMEKKK